MSAIALPKTQRYPHQEDMVGRARNAFRAHKRVLLQPATGSGKTVMFCDIAPKAIAKGVAVRVILRSIEIPEQTISKLQAFGIEAAFIGHSPGWQNAPIAVGMAITAKKVGLGQCGLIVVDECQHAPGKTWASVLADYPEAFSIGLTVTPSCLDEARTIHAAKRFVREPLDLLVVKENCRRRDGKKYTDASFLCFCAEEFFPDRSFPNALYAAGQELGKGSYVAKALDMGFGWATEPAGWNDRRRAMTAAAA